MSVSGKLPVSNGGTGLTSSALAGSSCFIRDFDCRKLEIFDILILALIIINILITHWTCYLAGKLSANSHFIKIYREHNEKAVLETRKKCGSK